MAFNKIAAALILTSGLVTSTHAASATEGSAHKAGRTDQQTQVLTTPRATSLGSPDEERRYAAREAASPAAKNYRAGDVVIISASALAVILLVVLIIILI
jgi:hypothetical protein